MNAILSAALNGFVVSIPLVCGVWIALRASRRWLNAATRYGVWWIALAVVAAMPLLYVPVRTAPHMPIVPAVRSSTVIPPAVIAAPPPAEKAARAKPASVRKVTFNPGILPVRFVQLWAIAAILTTLRLVVSYAMLHRRKTRATDAGDRLATFVEASLARLGTGRRVRVAVVEDAVSPMLAGPFRPSILLPSPLLTAMQDAEIEQICLHEAAHVARYDDWALLAQRLIETVFALHPLVRWISRQIHLEREIACDDVVIARTGLAKPYAACLTHAAELACGFSASPMAAAATDERSHLAKRVEMLLDRTRHKGTRLLGIRFAALAAGVILLGLASAKTPGLIAFAAAQKTIPDAVAPSFTKVPRPAPVLVAQTQVTQRPAAAAPLRVSLVPVSVTDPYGRFVTGLGRDTFQVFEDGVEQKIVYFIRDDEPSSLAVVWGLKDGLASTRVGLEELRKKRAELLNFYRPDHPDVKKLDVQIAELEHRNPLPPLMVALQALDGASELLMVPMNGNESLLDAIRAGVARLAGTANRRTGLVVFYDPAATGTLWPENEINEAVREAGMPVYAIGLTDPISSKTAGPTAADALLQLLANATGGREYSGATPDKVPGIVEQIGVETANRYVLGYIPNRPPDNGKYRKLDIRLQEPSGLPPLIVRFRAGFYE